jgi:hypothetical protein
MIGRSRLSLLACLLPCLAQGQSAPVTGAADLRAQVAVSEMGGGARKPVLKSVNNRFGFGPQRLQLRLDQVPHGNARIHSSSRIFEIL